MALSANQKPAMYDMYVMTPFKKLKLKRRLLKRNTSFRGVGIFQIGDETVEVDGNKEPTLGKFTIIFK